MRAGKIIAYIIAAILIFFGVLFLWGSTAETGSTGWIPIGLISIAIGLVLIFWAARQKAQPDVTNVTYNIDLPGNVKTDSIQCPACGGAIKANDIEMINGAPIAKCPFCGNAFQITEEPKW